MIVDVLLQILGTVIQAVNGLLPAWTVTAPPAAFTALGYLTGLDSFLPLTELMVVLVATATIGVSLHAFKWAKQVIDWVADVLP